MSQPVPKPSWKEEVNRRLEAHKSRRGISVVAPQPSSGASGAVDARVARVAARVAARYAKAPSYSEMQAEEARAALRTAEAATRMALEAQAAAQAVLASLHPHAGEEEATETGSQPETAVIAALDLPQPARHTVASAAAPLQVRWEPDIPERTHVPPTPEPPEEPQSEPDEWWNMPGPSIPQPDQAVDTGVEAIEAAQPIPANLIQFPRELVATRRMRPRLSGAPQGSAGDPFGQLSIFEVDPQSVSTEPAANILSSAALPPMGAGAEWSGIELGAHPEGEPEEAREETPRAASELHLAPFGLRLMATVVDLALVLGLVCAAVASVVNHLPQMPSLRVAEIAGAAALLLTGVLYHAFFLLVARTTPGMMYAGIALCTFEDEYPTPVQLRDRLLAMLISLLPVGLGFAWSAFDEDHLYWHDRLSRTYLREK